MPDDYLDRFRAAEQGYRPTHRCEFVGGPHAGEVQYLPSMLSPEPALPPLWVEVEYELEPWAHPRPPGAPPGWRSPTARYVGTYARERVAFLAAASYCSETWTYTWAPQPATSTDGPRLEGELDR